MSPEVIELSFKRNRKGLFLNPCDIKLKIGEYVIVEVDKGIDLGKVTQIGRLVMLKNIKENPKNIIRIAEHDDLETMKWNRQKEIDAFSICKELIVKHKLNMKLVDVEYQFDKNKLTFFFTSDQRVDFRALVKDLASKYRTRIELRQISVREEAKKIGGLGICGNQLCCCSFMDSFSPISTNDAKEQNLPMNPSKLSGLCGRLKCCLMFEKLFYSESLQNFPPLDSAVETPRGRGYIDKIDIFNNSIVLRFNEDEYENYSLEEVNAMMNNGKKNN
jgi:cell fate regulator YaaT (PSP1 superfamily)